jgi:hypothetical protein
MSEKIALTSQKVITLSQCLILSAFITGCPKEDAQKLSNQAREVVTQVKQLQDVTESTGKFVINPQFDFAIGFADGLAVVQIGDDRTGKWGYIDKQGKMIINPQFDFAIGFADGLAAVRIGDDKTGKWGFIARR